jgi:TM2 domain-containing membrane protein YozV
MSRFNCPTCGETFVACPVDGRAFSCTHCGRVFHTPPTASAATSVNADEDFSSAPEEGDRKRCNECGGSMRSSVLICPHCGDKQRKQTVERSSRRRRSRDDDYHDDYDDDRDDRHSKSRAIQDASSKKLAAGLLAIFAGTFGIHKFILGFTTPGLIYLISTIVTCGFAGIVLHVVALVEAIIYLSKSDEDFYYTYIVDKKEWF